MTEDMVSFRTTGKGEYDVRCNHAVLVSSNDFDAGAALAGHRADQTGRVGGIVGMVIAGLGVLLVIAAVIRGRQLQRIGQ